MAPATEEHNDMINEPVESSSGEYFPGTEHKSPHPEETIDEDDGPFADRDEDVTTTGDDSISIDGETNGLEGTLDSMSPTEDTVGSECGGGLDSDSNQDATKYTQGDVSSNGEVASYNDPGELSEDAAGERPVRQKLKETSIAGVARAKSPIEDTLLAANSPCDFPMVSQESPLIGEDQASEASSVDGRGRSRRKRSFSDHKRDDYDYNAEQKDDEEDGHRRKRSRESTAEDNVVVQEQQHLGSANKSGETCTKEQSSKHSQELGAEMPTKEDGRGVAPDEPKRGDRDAVDTVFGPKKKRSRDQFDKDFLKAEDDTEKAQESDTVAHSERSTDNDKFHPTANRSVEGEPEKKRHRDNSQERNLKAESVAAGKVSLSNPFSNASTLSPFASLASPKPVLPAPQSHNSQQEHPITSSSAFASSSLAAFAGSNQSPFGTLGRSAATASAFKPPAGTPASGMQESAPASSAFSPSPFAAAGMSSFASFGGGFGGSAFASGFGAAAASSGGGLASFAAAAGPGILGCGSQAKVLGTQSDDEDVEGDDNEKPSFEPLEEEKEDERFYKQETETGEEGEVTYFLCRGKLFHFDGREWKERGVGTFKVNVTELYEEDDEEEEDLLDKKTARLLMRSDGVLRVILNSPVFKGMKAGDPSGQEPTDKQVHLAGIENGRTVPLLLRTGKVELAKELYHTIQDLQPYL